MGEKNENLFSFPSLNRNFALSFRLARRYFRSKILKLIWYFAHLFVSFTYGEDRLHFGNKRKKSTFSLYFTQFALSLQREMKKIKHMDPKIGDRMKVSPQLTDQADWIDGEVIDVEHNPFMGLVISIKDKLGRIFFGQSRFFVAL